MSKRPWEGIQVLSPSSAPNNDTANGSNHHNLNGDNYDFMPAPSGRSDMTNSNMPAPNLHHQNGSIDDFHPIYRKIKACNSCRKQKIKCLMDDGGPPCRRCAKKSLDCVVAKSLQAYIEEKIPFTDGLVQDLDTLHASVQTILSTLNLPTMPPLQFSKNIAAQSPIHSLVNHDEGSFAKDVVGPSCDNSPRISPRDEGDVPEVPIRSLYHLTKLSALRSPAASEETPPAQHLERDPNAIDDFISRGSITLEDAERLFRLYMDHLDNYMYGVVSSRYRLLDTMRRRTPILTAAVLTVASMHDAQSNGQYVACNREFQRLVTSSLLERQIDRDHLRALCVGSYWLYDTSWVMSGVASRRAAEFDIAGLYQRLIAENNEDSADFVRVWYLIYICDQHLSTLYGRQSSSREDMAVLGWEAFIRASTATTGDRRLASQVNLLAIMQSIRDVFSPSSGEQLKVPAILQSQIKGFARQLDEWIAHWPSSFPEYQENFPASPRKLAYFHFHFAKLNLYSHIFRGLGGSPVPPQLSEAAHLAVSAATSILDMIISDDDVQTALVGLPCYIQSMIGFACMFLARVSMVHGDTLIERSHVVDLISRVTRVYGTIRVGKWHLIHLMPGGLEKILAMLQMTPAGGSNQANTNLSTSNGGQNSLLDHQDPAVETSLADLDSYIFMDTGMSQASQQLYFGNNNFNFSASGSGYS